MNNVIRVIPAYGRNYSNSNFVLDDWNANKDFVMLGQANTYINKSDFKKYGNPLDSVIYSFGKITVPLETLR